MKICFDWEESMTSGTSIKCYVNGNIAAQTYFSKFTFGYKKYWAILYGIEGYGKWNNFYSLEIAKKYCDDVLNGAGIKTVGEEYKVLM